MTTTATTTLWRCPRCGARLVTRNLSHACGKFTVAGFLRGRSKAARAWFRRFEAMVAKCGPYHRAPAKTRVAFMADVRFASVNALFDDRIDIHFVLPRRIRHRRIRVEKLGKLYVHRIELSARKDFDRQLQSWLRASYREYGKREWLSATRGRRARRSRH